MSIEQRDMGSPARYRLEVEGELGQEWAEWFPAASLRTEAGRTVVELEIVDQAHLQGILRRLPELNLTLVSLARSDAATDPEGGTP